MTIATPSTLAKSFAAPELRLAVLWQRELFIRHAPLVHLVRQNLVSTRVDKFRKESTDPLPESVLIETHAFVMPSPEKQKLKKYGIDTPRDLLVYFSAPLLADLGLIEDREDFLLKDWVKFDGDLYQIDEQRRDAYWATTNVPLQIVCACSRYRYGR